MLTLIQLVKFARKVPLWLYEAAGIVVAVIVLVSAFAAKEREIGAARERLKTDSVQLVADAKQTTALSAQRDSAARAFDVVNARLSTALTTEERLRALINVSAATPDTVRVPVQAAYVKACDFVMAACDSVRRAAVEEKRTSDSVIASLHREVADAQKQHADGTTAAQPRSRAANIAGDLLAVAAGVAACRAFPVLR